MQKEYELFVVDTTAVAVRSRDGEMTATEYIPVTPFLLQNMLSQKGITLGCYQRNTRTNPDTLDLF